MDGDYQGVSGEWGLEHRPWIPEGFSDRVQRILIVGHSHHKSVEVEDHVEFTIGCVANATDGKMQNYPFFARQPRYISLSRRDYYESVALINFVPQALPHRYAEPTFNQLQHARERFFRVLRASAPTHVFVLSSRLVIGRELPMTREQLSGQRLNCIEAGGSSFPWGTYQNDDADVYCCRLRHPQAARTSVMQDAFRTMLTM